MGFPSIIHDAISSWGWVVCTYAYTILLLYWSGCYFIITNVYHTPSFCTSFPPSFPPPSLPPSIDHSCTLLIIIVFVYRAHTHIGTAFTESVSVST